jgi:hypothetical protein
MIPVHVGEQDVIHLLRAVARGAQVRLQLSEPRSEEAAAAGVDQDELRAAIDQECIIGCRKRVAQERGFQLRFGMLRRLIQHLDGIEARGAVIERGHLDITQHHTEKSGRLESGQRGFGQRMSDRCRTQQAERHDG